MNPNDSHFDPPAVPACENTPFPLPTPDFHHSFLLDRVKYTNRINQRVFLLFRSGIVWPFRHFCNEPLHGRHFRSYEENVQKINLLMRGPRSPDF